MPTHPSLDYDALLTAIDNGAGIRARMNLQPLGGPGTKIFPPSYYTNHHAPDGSESKYAWERRTIDRHVWDCVVLDSVSSWANRAELALVEAQRRGEIDLAMIVVDFTRQDSTAHLGLLPSMLAPHRVFDALLRDSLVGDVLFRLSEPGVAITEASPGNAAAMLHYSPETLLFGGWDSTGPRGGHLGAKYERAITGEIVGIGAVPGVKTSSRVDPAAIEKAAGPVYAADGDFRWTLDKDEASGSKGIPPSEINHGNIAPTIDTQAGGVTVEEIVWTGVISFGALRRLKFPRSANGGDLDDTTAATRAAHAALAALGLCAMVHAHHGGYDLRSRCSLVAEGELAFELLDASGESMNFGLDPQEANALLAAAKDAVVQHGLTWLEQDVVLEPAPRLVELIERSRAADKAEASA